MLTADEVYETIVKQMEPTEQLSLAERIRHDISRRDLAVAAGLLKRPKVNLPLERHIEKIEVIGPDSVLDQVSLDRE